MTTKEELETTMLTVAVGDVEELAAKALSRSVIKIMKDQSCTVKQAADILTTNAKIHTDLASKLLTALR